MYIYISVYTVYYKYIYIYVYVWYSVIYYIIDYRLGIFKGTDGVLIDLVAPGVFLLGGAFMQEGCLSLFFL